MLCDCNSVITSSCLYPKVKCRTRNEPALNLNCEGFTYLIQGECNFATQSSILGLLTSITGGRSNKRCWDKNHSRQSSSRRVMGGWVAKWPTTSVFTAMASVKCALSTSLQSYSKRLPQLPDRCLQELEATKLLAKFSHTWLSTHDAIARDRPSSFFKGFGPFIQERATESKSRSISPAQCVNWWSQKL